MKIIYYTSGVSGSGRVAIGISIGNALTRKNITCEFIILSSSPFAYLAEVCGHKHLEIPPEDENLLSPGNYSKSILFNTLIEEQPDVLLIDHMWFTLYHFIDKLSCKKIYLSRQVITQFFDINLPSGSLTFDPEQYEKIIAIEPFDCDIPMTRINPCVLRNKDEILPRKSALEKLNLTAKGRKCLLAINGRPGDFVQNKNKYVYLENEGLDMFYTTNYAEDGIFPIIDYFNAFDLVICQAGYNQFWETKYFNKETIYETIPLHFTSMKRRIAECSNFYFKENGADQLVKIIMNL